MWRGGGELYLATCVHFVAKKSESIKPEIPWPPSCHERCRVHAIHLCLQCLLINSQYNIGTNKMTDSGYHSNKHYQWGEGGGGDWGLGTGD